ncbi:MAG: rRNA maturation RNase YbeY [Chloroflexi bacterium]|nr:MAG: rRNA maturation RNase YbeY [Chloroflexota bacterium]
MPVQIEIDDPFAAELPPDLIERAALLTLQRYQVSPASTVTISITDSETVRELNARFRGINAATDVLSFENTPDPDFPAGDTAHLGDVVIAYPVAQAQATAAGHRPQDEVALLTVHGVLHLLGLDHDTPTAKAEMWAVQQEILSALGLENISPTEG